ncbi:MAG: hypothetical protein ACRDK0_02010 [Solirubrobacteraceae bacterium]
MSDLDQLVDTLLYEGYALYPYTPGATKNATPTPFGIVYPPAYARHSGATHDRLRIECVVEGGGPLEGTVRCLTGAGERHKAVERRIELAGPGEVGFDFDGIAGRAGLEVSEGQMALWVVNETGVPDSLDRTAALRHSLLSTHVVARVRGGRFISPLDPAAKACEQVNTWPVLATPADDAVLGAAIMLPDHPQLAPESRGSLFDSTEIEEALLLHVMALSDDEREATATQDPAVRAMLERAVRTTPQEIMALHGRVTVKDPEQGEREATVGGVTYRPGATVLLRPGPGRNAQDHLVAGRHATIERIYVDFDGRVQLAVTVDGVPGQDIMRDIRRYLFFRPDEVDMA